jgi:CheY-like chemotaxis protein
LILDLMMPGLIGWELCRLIRNHNDETVREAEILMLSARATEEDRGYGLNPGADDYLTKPFSLSELLLGSVNGKGFKLLGKPWLNNSRLHGSRNRIDHYGVREDPVALTTQLRRSINVTQL